MTGYSGNGYIFVVLELKTRRIIHTGVTKYPTDEWTARQLREATPWGKGSKYLISDRDSRYATHFSAVAVSTGIKELKTPYRTPQANGVCERFMGSLRRECMDHILIHDDKHLRQVVNAYTASQFFAYDVSELTYIFAGQELNEQGRILFIDVQDQKSN
jgi:transposase InsO family protein